MTFEDFRKPVNVSSLCQRNALHNDLHVAFAALVGRNEVLDLLVRIFVRLGKGFDVFLGHTLVPRAPVLVRTLEPLAGVIDLACPVVKCTLLLVEQNFFDQRQLLKVASRGFLVLVAVRVEFHGKSVVRLADNSHRCIPWNPQHFVKTFSLWNRHRLACQYTPIATLGRAKPYAKGAFWSCFHFYFSKKLRPKAVQPELPRR